MASGSKDNEEVTKDIQEITKRGYTLLMTTVRDSNSFPSGEEYNKFATHTSFNLITKEFCNLSNRSVNNILTKQNVNLKFMPGDDDKEKIVDANDAMLENVNILLDVFSGFRKMPATDPVKDVQTTSHCNSISSWNKEPVIEKIHLGSKVLIAAKNITRPQINFKDPVDNSPTRLWIPKIKYKPNALKPLSFVKEFDLDGMEIGYKNPYEFEINSFDPEKYLIADEVSPEIPGQLHDTPLTIVENDDQLNELIDHLKSVKEIAIDVEHHSYRTYLGITCFVQLTTEEGGDFIIDAISLRDQLHKLNEAFTNPNILKILHGADNDVEWLQRDLGIYLVGVWDSYRATKLLSFSGGSLAFLVKHYCNVNLNKQYSLADWRIRPLPDFLVDYARSDTHYLLYIWKRMKADLLSAANGKTHLLESVFNQTKLVCSKPYHKPILRENSHLSVFKHHKKNLNSRQMEALIMLYKWRDTVARNEDESLNYVLPEHMLLPLATALPRELQGILALCHPVPPLVRQHLNTLHKIILKCREMPLRPTEVVDPIHVQETDTSTQDTYPHFDLDESPMTHDEPTAYAGKVRLQIPDNFTMVSPKLFYKMTPQNTNVTSTPKFTPISRYFKYRKIAQEHEWVEYNKQQKKLDALAKNENILPTAVEFTKKVSATAKDSKKSDNESEIIDSDVELVSETIQASKKNKNIIANVDLTDEHVERIVHSFKPMRRKKRRSFNSLSKNKEYVKRKKIERMDNEIIEQEIKEMIQLVKNEILVGGDQNIIQLVKQEISEEAGSLAANIKKEINMKSEENIVKKEIKVEESCSNNVTGPEERIIIKQEKEFRQYDYNKADFNKFQRDNKKEQSNQNEKNKTGKKQKGKRKKNKNFAKINI